MRAGFDYDRFDLADALWCLCSGYHSGMSSRGYRILSRLSAWGYDPPRGAREGERPEGEGREVAGMLFDVLRDRYADTL